MIKIQSLNLRFWGNVERFAALQWKVHCLVVIVTYVQPMQYFE